MTWGPRHTGDNLGFIHLTSLGFVTPNSSGVYDATSHSLPCSFKALSLYMLSRPGIISNALLLSLGMHQDKQDA